MAKKKGNHPENNIIPFQKGQTYDNDSQGDVMDMEDVFFSDDEEEEDELSEEMAQHLMTALLSGMIGGGMTNEQYKGMLLDSLQPWKEVLKLAQAGDTLRIVQTAKDQIAIINKKLRF